MKGRQWFTALVMIVVTAAAAFAQVQSGSITGTVVDEQGGVLPGVTITLQGDGPPQYVRHRTWRPVPIHQRAAGNVPARGLAAGIPALHSRGHRRGRRPERAAAADARRRDGAGSSDGHRRLAGHRHQSDGHGDQLHAGRAEPRAELARSVGAAPHGAGRDARPRQHRRQRDRPAVGVRLQGRTPGRRRVDDGRRADHRHGHQRRARRPTSITTRSTKSRSRRAATTSSRPPAASASTSSSSAAPTSSAARRAATTRAKTSKRRTCPTSSPPAASPARRPTTISRSRDVGFDVGGPIVKDKLFFWGSIGQQDIRLYRQSARGTDRTILKTYNAKVNWQATSKDMVNFLFFNGDKIKNGRAPGNALFEPTSAR